MMKNESFLFEQCFLFILYIFIHIEYLLLHTCSHTYSWYSFFRAVHLMCIFINTHTHPTIFFLFALFYIIHTYIYIFWYFCLWNILSSSPFLIQCYISFFYVSVLWSYFVVVVVVVCSFNVWLDITRASLNRIYAYMYKGRIFGLGGGILQQFHIEWNFSYLNRIFFSAWHFFL